MKKMKSGVAMAALSMVLAAPVLADGTHSHAHGHPHTGHATHGDVDPNLLHSHGGAEIGTTHTHEINGVTLRHTHATQPGGLRTTFVDRWNDKLAAREATYGRREVGAGFGPYSVAEWNARAAAGQPGITHYQEPWPRRKWYHSK